ncbi:MULTISPECIES: carbohydrate ABC transporter permease [Globicatella]|uniref:Carbohydrate ABC transporter membrane protein 1, CUT1 family (TC 3.A.1.1.-) n=2 Tax=Globicatella sulfidifaciens TaxID=136093 RepID=A0A1T4LT27_9LACT|nr:MULTISPECIES: sugar ABC transporter permease [Globicatella]NLJ18238.1 sugar ABC transporter permease [Globicatella sulfidifaciens]WPC08506.1 sugar ABC transporter permease [Globicatella sp. PHS-GS-PNBC-21-1553]SJZ57862.1 carbohydrate ABC transporter membrane protein 1, CUT1 family (TC 3.A.1.1.-) [Globicatella sulfidifaciens DSM 15739]
MNQDVVIIKEEQTFFDKIKGYLYLSPAIIILSLFMFWPFIQTLYRSMFLTNNMGANVEYLGFGNYTELLSSDSFWNSVKTSFVFVVIVVVVGVTIGFLTALLCQKSFPGVKFFSTSYAMPMAIASAGMAMIFQVMLNPTVGIINRLLGTYINYLTKPETALLVIGVLTGWLNSGMNFLYFSSGLASIDDALYESGQVDGANGFQQFLYITIPSLKPTLFFVIVTNIINAFQGFGQINILTKGGPGQATNVIVYDIYRNAFMNYRYGFASAESVILFIIVMLLTIVMFKLRRKEQ